MLISIKVAVNVKTGCMSWIALKKLEGKYVRGQKER